MSNQNQQLEGHTIQWSENRGHNDKQRPTKHYQET